MTASIRKIPNEIFFAQVMELLEEGQNVTIQVSGRSMSPTFKDGVDKIVISPFKAEDLEKGDVVLFNRGDTICVHRIIRRKGDKLVIRGDGNSLKALEYARTKDVMGLITGGTMFGGIRFSVSDRKWKLNTRFVLTFAPLLALWHRVKFIVRRYPLSVLTFCILLYLSIFNPVGKELPSFENSDKLAHILMYFGVSSVFWFEWLHRHELSGKTYLKGLVRCLALPVLLGVLLELFQEYCLAYRDGDFMDVVANCIGTLLALILSFGLTVPVIRKYRSSNAFKK